MQVTFKLTPDQRKIALAILARTVEEAEAFCLEKSEYEEQTKRPSDYHNHCVWCGNLKGYQGGHQAFNGCQDLNLSQDGWKVTYEGQRHPLFQDGGMRVLEEIAGGNPASRSSNKALGLVVTYYNTSERGMKWWETCDGYLARIDAKGILAWAARRTDITRNEAYSLAERVKKDPSLQKVEVGSAAYKRRSAEGTLGNLKEVNHLFKLLAPHRYASEELESLLESMGKNTPAERARLKVLSV